jgi:kynurenine formamidase
MEAIIQLADRPFKVNLHRPIDISIAYSSNSDALRAWYLGPLKIEAVRTEQFLGSVAEGGSVNFRNITFNPHGHGTHTECVGHIAKTVYSVNAELKEFFAFAALSTYSPKKPDSCSEWMAPDDLVIDDDLLSMIPRHKGLDALIIRTLPNDQDKLHRNYSSTNPPYLTESCMKGIVDLGIRHLLIDLPSVDRELDGGKLRCHHLFWEHPANTRHDKTITELIYVPDEVEDGLYLLELQVAPFENDASPSRPVLYKLEEV